MSLASPIPPLEENPYPTVRPRTELSATAEVQFTTWSARLSPFDAPQAAALQKAGDLVGTVPPLSASLSGATLNHLNINPADWQSDFGRVLADNYNIDPYRASYPQHPGTLPPASPTGGARSYMDGNVPGFLKIVYDTLALLFRSILF